MEGDDRTRLRSFLGQLGDELRRGRAESDLVVLDPGPPVPEKPNLALRKYIDSAVTETKTLRRRSTGTVTAAATRDRRFNQLKQRIDELANTKAIETIEERMRQANDPFLTQIACERRRLQLAAGACLTALGQLQKAIDEHR